MKTEMMKPLTVYRASAGAGKTFKLATQYISLLILNPQSYRGILAVTFTNKATEEMKMRILSQLYGISHHLNDSEEYLKEVQQNTGLGERLIRQRAGGCLSLLLHHFNDFRIETIDAFFQTVLRNLARELDLTASLNISLNDEEVMEQAVDDLIEQLDEKSPVLSWIMDYIHEKMDDDKGWNIMGQIKNFGKNIFEDAYKEHSYDLQPLMSPESTFFPDYSKELRAIRQKAKENIKKYADHFFEEMDRNGFSASDLNRGEKGIWSYFAKLERGEFTDESKLVNKTVCSCLEDPKNWVTKKRATPGSGIYQLVQDHLWTLLRQTETARPDLVKAYKSADLTLRHLDNLRLLGKIGEKVRISNQEANRFLLSDTQNLLHSLVCDNDSPFIFEKIGAHLEHIMMDEFQDTSRIQWYNFKVLLQETMSHGQPPSEHLAQNLIVGDIKQSIYRWRGGDWRLLQNIDTKEFSSDQVNKKILDVNYRSDKRIVAFNNIFFLKASQSWSGEKEKDTEELQQAYSQENLCQKVPEGKENQGYVHVELLPDNNSYHDKMLQKTVETVRTLLDQGCRPSDIAILVRKNPTIQEIGAYFMEKLPDVTLVSDLAFRLDASQAVNILVDALRFITHRDDLLTLANLTKAYQTGIKNPLKADSKIFLCSGNTLEEQLKTQLPDDYVNHLDELEGQPLMDLIEQLYSIFDLAVMEEQSAYVCAFYDQVSEYLQDHVPDINDFLKVWDEDLHLRSIQSDETDGIRLLTIHKSKGLEFDHVIIPFCDWTLEKPGYTIWCTPSEPPYSKLPVVPVDLYKNQMSGSIYEPFYNNEHSQNIVDNMNLLYVAFTRPKRGLYIFGKHKNKGKQRMKADDGKPSEPVDESDVIEKVLPQLSQELEGATLKTFNQDEPAEDDISDKDKIDDKEDDNSQTLAFDYGTPDINRKPGEKTVSRNVFLQQPEPKIIAINNYENRIDFRQSNKSKDFIGGEDEEAQVHNTYIQTGNVLHAIFSSIHTLDDVDQALSQLEQEGVLDTGYLSKEKLRKEMKQRLQSPKVKNWFSSHWELFNECTILYTDPVTNEVIEKRPDRVMTDGKEMIVVDFKFGKPHKEYEEQVRDYMTLLRRMHYPEVSGYLWYVYPNQVTQVRPDDDHDSKEEAQP